MQSPVITAAVLDIVASRSIEIMLTIPTFFLIVTVVAFLPKSVFNIMFVIGLTNWPTVARLTRGEFLKTKSLEYVVAARAMGATDFRTIFRHVLPNALAPVFCGSDVRRRVGDPDRVHAEFSRIWGAAIDGKLGIDLSSARNCCPVPGG